MERRWKSYFDVLEHASQSDPGFGLQRGLSDQSFQALVLVSEIEGRVDKDERNFSFEQAELSNDQLHLTLV